MKKKVEIVTKGFAPRKSPGDGRIRDAPNVGRELLFLLAKIVGIVFAFVLIFTVLFGIIRYDDASMHPAIREGDLVMFYRFNKDYVANDVIALKYQGKIQIRRVVAVEGDEVDVKEGDLYINESRQTETGIYEETQRFDIGVEFPLRLKEGQIFVLGDSRESSIDGRMYGAVNAEDTLGSVMTVIRRRGF
ncbi:MAG: signal peptidase I [Lachnospiraceae bacterium]